MKAWTLSIKDDPDQGTFVVFADTREEARSYADSNDLIYDRWVDIEALRFYDMDDKEHLDKAHLLLELWRDHGWRFVDELGEPDADEATDEEFLEWYSKNFTGR